MPANISDLVPVVMCGMSWIVCTLVSPNSCDHSDRFACARKLQVMTCIFPHALWLIVEVQLQSVDVSVVVDCFVKFEKY